MMVFKNILNFPIFFKDRFNSWKTVKISKLDTKKDTNKFNIMAVTNNKYDTEIEIDLTQKSLLNCPVKFSCTCDSFKYEFANAVFKNDSLLNPTDFFKSIITKPKQKNVYNTPSGCKHVIAVANSIWSKLHQLKLKERNLLV